MIVSIWMSIHRCAVIICPFPNLLCFVSNFCRKYTFKIITFVVDIGELFFFFFSWIPGVISVFTLPNRTPSACSEHLSLPQLRCLKNSWPHLKLQGWAWLVQGSPSSHLFSHSHWYVWKGEKVTPDIVNPRYLYLECWWQKPPLFLGGCSE